MGQNRSRVGPGVTLPTAATPAVLLKPFRPIGPHESQDGPFVDGRRFGRFQQSLIVLSRPKLRQRDKVLQLHQRAALLLEPADLLRDLDMPHQLTVSDKQETIARFVSRLVQSTLKILGQGALVDLHKQLQDDRMVAHIAGNDTRAGVQIPQTS
jgi:hypothetical protein